MTVKDWIAITNALAFCMWIALAAAIWTCKATSLKQILTIWSFAFLLMIARAWKNAFRRALKLKKQEEADGRAEEDGGSSFWDVFWDRVL